MVSREENNLLTRTGPRTPCGEMMRRYWQPAALSEELPPGGAPLPVTLLGEELVMFRDDKGEPALIGIHCAHRGADLSYGRLEDGGLRCIYHGWLYDKCGNVLDQPGEPQGGENRSSIRHPAYPCQEAGGVVFAYLGPGEPPLLPSYEFLTVPEERRTVTKVLYECNYLQANEGNIDPVHLSFLHQFLEEGQPMRQRFVSGSSATDYHLLGRDLAPVIEVEVTDFGLRIYAGRKTEPENWYLRITNFILPNLAAFGGSTIGEGYSVHWHVPVDDSRHWKFIFMFSREKALDQDLREKSRFEVTPDYALSRNAANRYRQDRDSMATKTYTGMGANFQAHDAFATESQGEVQDRTAEHLVSSDKAIVAARKLLLNAIEEVRQGRDPRHVVRDPEANRFPHLIVQSEVVPASTDWKEYARQLERAKREAAQSRENS
jgi:phenylpropionate dioxygenase-like ring-hydroxylating dioxygenase large terminal subunit